MRHKQLGVSLIELMIAVAIVGILTAIAYPSYRQYVLRGNRTEAKAAIMQASQALEKCFTRFGSYTDAGCQISTNLARANGLPSESGRYVLSFSAIANTTFTIRAVPQAEQARDPCGTLQMDQAGLRQVGGLDVRTCW
jgi:type IV pilus assembly protein PilE